MERIVVGIKRTKWERDLMRYISPEAVRELYRMQNNAFERVYESHSRQQKSLQQVRDLLPEASFVFREDLPHLDYRRFDTIVSVGGDNHFIHLSHYADSHLMIGVNSDPTTSSGALLYFTPDMLAEKIAGKNPKELVPVTENWTRIEGELIYPDGRKTITVPCTSEVSIRNSFPDTMSRYLIRIADEQWEEQKSSGLLLSSGAGSTGWFKNCLPAEDRKDAVFEKTADFFKFVAREPGYKKGYRYQLGTVRSNQHLDLISEMEGEISIDANPDRTFDFPPGCRARFYLTDNHLKVVKDLTS